MVKLGYGPTVPTTAPRRIREKKKNNKKINGMIQKWGGDLISIDFRGGRCYIACCSLIYIRLKWEKDRECTFLMRIKGPGYDSSRVRLKCTYRHGFVVE